MNALTTRQQRALRNANPAQRAAMRAGFQRQGSGQAKPRMAARLQSTRQAGNASQGVVRVRPKNLMSGSPHHFDAFTGVKPQALSFSVGPAVGIRGAYYKSLTTVASSAYIVTFNVGGGAIVGIVHRETAPDTWTAVTTLSIPSSGLGGLGPSASEPDSFMPTRGSLRIRNVTRAADVAGVVRALRISAGIPTSNSAELTALGQYIRGHSRTRTYSAEELCTVHQWDQIPVSQDLYHHFTAPPTDLTGFQNYVQDPGVSTICLLIEANAQVQDYELTFAMNAWARYNVIGPLTNSYSLPQTVPLAVTNAMRDAAEAAGSVGKRIVGQALDYAGGYLGAMFAQRMASAASRVALAGSAAPLALTM